jgi:hypothetical protein
MPYLCINTADISEDSSTIFKIKQATNKGFYWSKFYQPTWRHIPKNFTLPLPFTLRIEQHTFHCDMLHCLHFMKETQLRFTVLW